MFKDKNNELQGLELFYVFLESWKPDMGLVPAVMNRGRKLCVVLCELVIRAFSYEWILEATELPELFKGLKNILN